MLYRIIFIALFSLLPVISYGQSKLILKEISFVFQYKDVSGTVGDFRSSSEVNLEDPSTSYFEGSVGVSSLKTGNFLRDWALKGRKYFNEDAYPRIYFKSDEVEDLGEGIRVKGQLTIKGTTNPLIINFKTTERGLSGKTELYTSDYGIFIKKNREENKVLISMVFELE
ncbi:YceI family protein [Lentiprolixibacter aurantiacus]|uniref:YceI family protein n=1 Tax=Lentiprolixibacter aurantiacus TaxID=2993939 RepID=A0AAE3SNY7_9FLAO|nr:YceI family protein [Lentiprolixibacter aurantiacus]MCX2719641.1 YceI family protein [Lentiprolixibacter aurantiacus]